MSCPECGSSNVVEDDLYSQRQWVCEDCGSLVSEGVFTTTLSEEQHSTTVPYYASTEVTKKPCPNLIKGLVRVRALCRMLRLPSDMESGAVSLFEQAYNHPSFINVSLQKKEVLSGCCVLSVCRQSDWAVCIGTISNLLDSDSALVGVIYQDLTRALNIQPNTTCITNMLESYCHGFKLAAGEVAEVFVESRRSLLERSAALLELASDTWLVTGRHPLPILMACVYVAWQSLKPRARLKLSLSKFLQISSVSKERSGGSGRRETVQKRITELKDVLCKLARELPWLTGGAVEPNTVLLQVEDILTHRQTLMLKAMRRYEEQNSPDCDQLTCTDPAAPEITHNPPADQPGLSSQSLSDGDGESESECVSAPPAGEVHWGKRQLFLPPSARAQKLPRTSEPELSVTGDEDISDSEIQSYIRSPEEVSRCLQAREKLNI